jgi:hypothetical protein
MQMRTKLFVLFATVVVRSALAETVVVNDQVAVRESSIARPERGMHMEQVEQKFGAPTNRHAAVGEPPITRWDYPSFAVFFEHDIVIHTVVVAAEHTPESPAQSAAASAPQAPTGDAQPSAATDSAGAAPTASGAADAPAAEHASDAAPASQSSQTATTHPAGADSHVAESPPVASRAESSRSPDSSTSP